MKTLSGGEMVAQALQDEGVEYIFGYPGGSVLHIYDALFKHSKTVWKEILQIFNYSASLTSKPAIGVLRSLPNQTAFVWFLLDLYVLFWNGCGLTHAGEAYRRTIAMTSSRSHDFGTTCIENTFRRHALAVPMATKVHAPSSAKEEVRRCCAASMGLVGR